MHERYTAFDNKVTACKVGAVWPFVCFLVCLLSSFFLVAVIIIIIIIIIIIAIRF
jgi:hypothetical protein